MTVVGNVCGRIPRKKTVQSSITSMGFPLLQKLETPIDSGIGLSIRMDNLRVFINKTLSIESLINQLLMKRAYLSISIDSR